MMMKANFRKISPIQASEPDNYLGANLQKRTTSLAPKIAKVDTGPFITISKAVEDDLLLMDDSLNISESLKNLKNEQKSSMLRVSVNSNHNRRYGPNVTPMNGRSSPYLSPKQT